MGGKVVEGGGVDSPALRLCDLLDLAGSSTGLRFDPVEEPPGDNGAERLFDELI